MGVRQSRRVAEILAGYGVAPTSLIHGGMRRQRDTARGDAARCPAWELPLETDERWRELDHLAVMTAYPTLTEEDRELLRGGGIELRAFHELYTKATARWASGAYDWDYPESFADFIGRVRDGIGHAARQAGERRTAVVVTSGGPIAAACAMLTEVGEEPRSLAAAWSPLQRRRRQRVRHPRRRRLDRRPAAHLQRARRARPDHGHLPLDREGS